MNHYMVFFSDHYNSIFLIELSTNIKIGSFMVFNNSFSDQLVFSSYAESYLFSFKI